MCRHMSPFHPPGTAPLCRSDVLDTSGTCSGAQAMRHGVWSRTVQECPFLSPRFTRPHGPRRGRTRESPSRWSCAWWPGSPCRWGAAPGQGSGGTRGGAAGRTWFARFDCPPNPNHLAEAHLVPSAFTCHARKWSAPTASTPKTAVPPWRPTSPQKVPRRPPTAFCRGLPCGWSRELSRGTPGACTCRESMA